MNSVVFNKAICPHALFDLHAMSVYLSIHVFIYFSTQSVFPYMQSDTNAVWPPPRKSEISG